jgi:hypothetical protein
MIEANEKTVITEAPAEMPPAKVASRVPKRINLFEVFPSLKKFAKWRSFQFLLVIPNLALFYLFLIAGTFGSPIGNRNIMIVFVWILWWFLLITFMVPFLSRIWCIVCPFPFFGDWLQRRALVKVRSGKTGALRNKMYGLNKKWPRKLSNIWIQNIGFLGLATFCAMLVTRPIVSVFVLGGLFILATVMAVIYQRRIFCNYICPVSGFLGLYSMSSTLELRARNREVCLKDCKEKSCATGSENGWACPWVLYMGKLDRNNFCGLCMECVKSCPNDNIGLFARPPFSDLAVRGYDEAWKSFIMLALAMVYSVVLLGPWGFVKDWANVSETGNWGGFLLFAAVTWGGCLVVFPGLHAATAWLGQKLSKATVDWKQLFLRYSYAFVPLGLFAWIAFSFPLVMVNGSYIISVASDPLGAGWDLFGTAHVPWTPIIPEYAVYLQIVMLLAGLGFALKKGLDVGKSMFDDRKQLLTSFAPVGFLCVLVTITFLKVFAG